MVFDYVFYANALFAPEVLTAIFGSGANRSVSVQIKELLLVYVIGLPGYFVSVYFMDYFGRKHIQFMGFTMMALLYLLLWIRINDMSSTELLLIYGLTFFFSNFGPNTTTFILPSETFPASVRASFNGLSAAAGKTGALLGAFTFQYMVNSLGTAKVFGICAVIAALGAALTAGFVIDARHCPPPAEPIYRPSSIELSRQLDQVDDGTSQGSK
jgi:PHS family inorganic phosphate transporter-like MFS transporter